jgi:NYN domain
VVKKAYCDWERYRDFKKDMHEASFEMIEIPHVRMSGKNSADIRMVVDALDLCYTKAHVDTFVIISGDSDFSPLVSKLRENNKTVIGVGVKNSTSDLLIANCDEFIFYDDLVREQRRRASVAAKVRAPARRKQDTADRGERSEKSENAEADGAEKAARPDRTEKADKGDKTDKTDKTDKADRQERGDKGERTAKAEGAGRADKGGRGGRGDRTGNAAARNGSGVAEASDGKRDIREERKEQAIAALIGGGAALDGEQAQAPEAAPLTAEEALAEPLGLGAHGAGGSGSAEREERIQRGLELVVETVDALLAERGEDERIWGSMVKQTLKRRNPGFNELYYGFKSFNRMLEEARDRNLVELETDDKSGGYTVRAV